MQTKLTTDKEKKEWIKNKFTNARGEILSKALKKYWLKNSDENKKIDVYSEEFWNK